MLQKLYSIIESHEDYIYADDAAIKKAINNGLLGLNFWKKIWSPIGYE